MANENDDRSMFTLVGFIHLEQLKENEGGNSCDIVKKMKTIMKEVGT